PSFAVPGHYPSGGGNVTDWKTLFDPRHANLGLDFAFALTTTPPNHPPPQCRESDVKFAQFPQLDGGFSLWDNGQWVLADDFICTNTGPVTDIHIWGSWLNDLVDPTPTFWLGIYYDVPAI